MKEIVNLWLIQSAFLIDHILFDIHPPCFGYTSLRLLSLERMRFYIIIYHCTYLYIGEFTFTSLNMLFSTLFEVWKHFHNTAKWQTYHPSQKLLFKSQVHCKFKRVVLFPSSHISALLPKSSLLLYWRVICFHCRIVMIPM